MEIWKDIKGYEGLYQVSSLGRVKSLNYLRTGKERIMKTAKNSDGYPHLLLKGKDYKIHRLVAETFIPNPDNKPCVDHINTDRSDNRVGNLRWCTQKENCNNQISKTNYQKGHFVPVVQLTLDGKPIKYFDKMSIEGFNSCNISLVCTGKNLQHKGYRWLYFDDFCDLY